MVHIHQFTTRCFGYFIIRPQIDMNLGARPARTGIAHLPEIIFFISVKDSVLGNPFFPKCKSLIVRLQFFASIAFKDRYIKSVFW